MLKNMIMHEVHQNKIQKLKMNRKTALLEFGLNLVNQEILTKNEFLEATKSLAFMLFDFELGYWIGELNMG